MAGHAAQHAPLAGLAEAPGFECLVTTRLEVLRLEAAESGVVCQGGGGVSRVDHPGLLPPPPPPLPPLPPVCRTSRLRGVLSRFRMTCLRCPVLPTGPAAHRRPESCAPEGRCARDCSCKRNTSAIDSGSMLENSITIWRPESLGGGGSRPFVFFPTRRPTGRSRWQSSLPHTFDCSPAKFATRDALV